MIVVIVVVSVVSAQFLHTIVAAFWQYCREQTITTNEPINIIVLSWNNCLVLHLFCYCSVYVPIVMSLLCLLPSKLCRYGILGRAAISRLRLLLYL